jgi:hypothetical protein
MAQGVWLFLAFAAVLVFPSSNLELFDGLPFSRLPEFAALGLAVSFLLFPGLRSGQRDFWKRRRIPAAFLWIVTGAVLALKIVLFASGAYSGFAGCYASPAEPTAITHEDLPARTCELSYENPFGRFGATRIDGAIRFLPDNWNLVFLNTDRYNYFEWEPGNILRTRMPIVAEWSGTPDLPSGAPVVIEYVGQGSVTWGDLRVDLPPAYAAAATVTVAAPRAAAPLRIRYAFDDGSRSGQDPSAWGPRASIVVSAGGSPLRAQPPALGWRILAWLADGWILLWLLSCLPALWRAVRSDRWILVFAAAGLGAFSVLPAAALVRTGGLIAVLALIFLLRILVRPLRPESVCLIVLAAAGAILRVGSSGTAAVLLRSAGNDALQYESQAYSILATGSLRGGESVFAYIPAYRYVKFLEHALFGDGNLLFSAVALALFFGGAFALFSGMERRSLPWVRRLLLAILGGGLIFLGGYYVASVIREGLSEYDTWILLLWSLPPLYASASAAGLLAGMAASGINYVLRPNQLLGILWTLALAVRGAWNRFRKTILLAVGFILLITLLPLVHNLYFGGQWVISATSGGMSVNLILMPATWLAFLRGDPAAGEIVRQQLGMLFLITDAPRSQWPTLAVLGVFLLVWIPVAAHAALRRKTADLAWLALPVFYLVIHLLYNVSTYYPRHIVAGYLAMAVTAALALIHGWKPSPAAAGAGVELPRT